MLAGTVSGFPQTLPGPGQPAENRTLTILYFQRYIPKKLTQILINEEAQEGRNVNIEKSTSIFTSLDSKPTSVAATTEWIIVSPYLRGNLKKPSISKDIVQIGGREVNPISKN